MDLARNDAQQIFKCDLDHLSLDPGLPWMFEESANTHIFREGHCIVCIPGHSVWEILHPGQPGSAANTSLYIFHTLYDQL